MSGRISLDVQKSILTACVLTIFGFIQTVQVMDPPVLQQLAVINPERQRKRNLTSIERKQNVSQLLLHVKKDDPGEHNLLQGQ